MTGRQSLPNAQHAYFETELAATDLDELPTGLLRWAKAFPLRGEVSDAAAAGDPPLPPPCEPSPEDESGRGLALVAALARAWGAHPRACGIEPVHTGDQVTYQGGTYQAKWYTRDQTPDTVNGGWKKIG